MSFNKTDYLLSTLFNQFYDARIYFTTANQIHCKKLNPEMFQPINRFKPLNTLNRKCVYIVTSYKKDHLSESPHSTKKKTFVSHFMRGNIEIYMYQ